MPTWPSATGSVFAGSASLRGDAPLAIAVLSSDVYDVQPSPHDFTVESVKPSFSVAGESAVHVRLRAPPSTRLADPMTSGRFPSFTLTPGLHAPVAAGTTMPHALTLNAPLRATGRILGWGAAAVL